MELRSNLVERTYNRAKVSIQVDLLDDTFKDVSFGVMYYNGQAQDGYITLTPYGLEHTNEGEHKEAISKALKKVEDYISSTYGVTFEERPTAEDMTHPIEDIVESSENQE